MDRVPPQEAGALGQVILVASRLGAYCRAAWYLLVAAGDSSASAPAPESAAPFSRYCEVLKLLMRHSILRRVQVCGGRCYLLHYPCVLPCCVLPCCADAGPVSCESAWRSDRSPAPVCGLSRSVGTAATTLLLSTRRTQA